MLNWVVSYCIMLTMALFFCKKIVLSAIKNTIQNDSIKLGVFSILGIILHFILISLISFIFCILSNSIALQYFQYISISYIVYLGICMMTKQQENISFDNVISVSTNVVDAIKNNFIHSISNYQISFVLFSIITQYYIYKKTALDNLIIIFSPSVITFIALFLVILTRYYLNKYSKKQFIGIISVDKLVSLIIIIITAQNLSKIIK